MTLTDSERESFEERAAICEYDGNCTRAQAEKLAMEQVMRERERKGERK